MLSRIGYVFLFYDVGAKRVRKVHDICLRYLYPFQQSVFRGNLSFAQWKQLRRDLEKVIDPSEDQVSLVGLANENSFVGEELGIQNYSSDQLFL